MAEFSHSGKTENSHDFAEKRDVQNSAHPFLEEKTVSDDAGRTDEILHIPSHSIHRPHPIDDNARQDKHPADEIH